MEKAAVFGAGTMGTALACAIGARGRQCVIWSDDAEVARSISSENRNPRHYRDHVLPRTITATTNIGDAAEGARLAIVAVGAEKIRNLAELLAEHLATGAHTQTVILSATKGLEPELGISLSQVLSRYAPGNMVGAISGPNITQDIIAGRPTGLIVASPSNAAHATARHFMESRSLRIFGSSDLIGVEMLGALKNVVVIAMGLAQGLGLGDNARSFLLALGMLEVQRLALHFGARPETIMGLAGIGDVFLSSTSAFSRNHMVGVELGKGRSLAELVGFLERLNETAEGVNTIRVAKRLAQDAGMQLPLVDCLHGVLFEQADARSALETLLATPEATRCLTE